MKKNIICLAILATSLGVANAQVTEFDAMTAVRTELNGTARYMGMAGAFGALGGDISAIKDNPAGLGVYRSSDVSGTFNFQTQQSAAAWNGTRMEDGSFRFGFDNVGIVMSFPTWAAQKGSTKGLLQSNWSFSYNRLKNFNRKMTIGGNNLGTSVTDFYANFTNGIFAEDLILMDNEYDPYDNVNIPWMSVQAFETGLIENMLDNGEYTDQWGSALLPNETVNSRYYLEESGNISEFALSWAGNISNKVYLGAGLNFQTINYSMRGNYIETFGQGENLDQVHRLSTGGLGVNFNLGVIYRPVDFLRLGLAYKTPMVYSLHDVSSGDMVSNLMTDEGLKTFSSDPGQDATYDYRVHTPGKVTASVAGIIGKRAVVSADFTYTNYRNIKLFDENEGSYIYEADNNAIRNTFNAGMTFKVGAEFRVTNHVSVRAGYAAETASMKPEATKEPHLNTVRTDTEYFRHRGTDYITAGLGYRGNFWYIDAAFVYKNLKEDFVPYNSLTSSPIAANTHNYDVVATVGFKF